MSNTYKIIKNFVSDKFSPELKEKMWRWLIDSAEQDEKDGKNKNSKPMQAPYALIRISARSCRIHKKQPFLIRCANGDK